MSDFSQVRHISLDVWNTIITPHSEYAECRAQLISKLTDCDADVVSKLYTKTKANADNQAVAFGYGHSTEMIFTWLVNDIFEAQSKHPSRTQVEMIRRAVEILFIKMRPTFNADIINELERLHSKGVRSSIASNSNFISGEIMGPYLASKFDKFKFMVFSDLELVSKPHPKFFSLVLSKTPFAPSQILHVGDSHECDVVGASFVGMQTKHVFDPTDTANFLSTLFAK